MALWQSLLRHNGRPVGALSDVQRTVELAVLGGATYLPEHLQALRGRSVFVAVRSPLRATALMIELDGLVSRMVVCPPGLSPEHLPYVIRTAGCDVWVGDAETPAAPAGSGIALQVAASADPQPVEVRREAARVTDWILLTSGTTGVPKLVRHTLSSLLNFIEVGESPTTWSTFYDIRRYGGLQILLRALLCGSLVLPGAAESIEGFLARAAASGVTHISGTPSHWRKALMSGAAERFDPRYIRLSGELADQGILDALRAAFPHARVAHAFASTEAGVAFEVDDGRAGFPLELLTQQRHGVELDTGSGTLRIRSPGNALEYLGDAPPLKDPDGFVDTGDRLDLREGRYFFMGRTGGIINVGGLKVHPEEVEAVINTHPAVQMSRVKARRNPITGAVVSAEVVLREARALEGARAREQQVREEILEQCRGALAAYKVPALVHFVPSLAVSPSGKLVRSDA